VALLLMVVVFAHLLYHERAELFSLLLFVGNHQVKVSKILDFSVKMAIFQA
jgi:hypothetical protein